MRIARNSPDATDGLKALIPPVDQPHCNVTAFARGTFTLDSLRRTDVLAACLEMPVARRSPGRVIAWRPRHTMRYATGGVVMAAAEVRC